MENFLKIVSESDENLNGVLEFREFVTIMTDMLGNTVQMDVRRKLTELKAVRPLICYYYSVLTTSHCEL